MYITSNSVISKAIASPSITILVMQGLTLLKAFGEEQNKYCKRKFGGFFKNIEKNIVFTRCVLLQSLLSLLLLLFLLLSLTFADRH